MAHPAPLSPLSPRESRSTVREGAGGTRRLWPVVRSQGKGSEVGARGAQGRECGVGGGRRGRQVPASGLVGTLARGRRAHSGLLGRGEAGGETAGGECAFVRVGPGGSPGPSRAGG